uniref:Uncharacterized protein n=1 Tax=Lactuca sativa TaxID=4236 RepID=A0A9R1VES8_LACSA|nr:hypothetical protein LSAT_V11C500289180 [Lactuca sativa]
MSLSHLMRITYPRLHFSMLQCHLHHRIVGEGAHPIGGTITTKDEVTTTIIDTNILQVNLLLFSSRAELIKASFMFHCPILFLICGLHLVKPNRTRLLLSVLGSMPTAPLHSSTVAPHAYMKSSSPDHPS